MNNLYLFLTCIFLFFSNSSLKAQTLNWAGLITEIDTNDLSYNYINSSTVDDQGNSYVVGVFHNQIDVDIGPGVSVLSTSGKSVFFAKYDHNGNLLFADKVDPLNGASVSGAIKIDNLGNIYYFLSLNGFVDLDPGPGTYLESGDATYIVKRRNDGTFVWANKIGHCGINDLAIDQSGNVYASGYYLDSLNFYNGTNPTVLYSNYSGVQNFYYKLDSNSTFQWAKEITNGANNIILKLTTDSLNNLYATGRFYGNVDFDPGPSSYYLNTTFLSPFVFSLDDSGNFRWASMYECDKSAQGHDLEYDKDEGYLYSSGFYLGTLRISTSNGMVSFDSSGRSVYVTKMDLMGNVLMAKNIPTVENKGLITGTIEVDENNNILLVGTFLDSVDFDPGPNEFYLNGIGGDIYFLSLNDSFEFNWVRSLTTGPTIGISSFDIDKNNNMYVSGYIQEACDFDPDSTGSFILYPNAWDPYLLSIKNAVLTKQFGFNDKSDIIVYPVPSQDYIRIELPKKGFYEVSIIDIHGKSIKIQKINTIKFDLNIAGLPSSVYFLKIKGNDVEYQSRIIKN